MQSALRGVSFVEVVKEEVKKKVWQRKTGGSSEVWRGLDFSVKEEDMAWLSSCFVDYVHNANTVYLLHDRIIDEGVFSFTIVPMEGDKVLIKPGGRFS